MRNAEADYKSMEENVEIRQNGLTLTILSYQNGCNGLMINGLCFVLFCFLL